MHSGVCVCLHAVCAHLRECVQQHGQCEGHACPCVPARSVCVCVCEHAREVSSRHSPASVVWCGPCVTQCVHTGPACKNACGYAAGMDVCVHIRVQWVPSVSPEGAEVSAPLSAAAACGSPWPGLLGNRALHSADIFVPAGFAALPCPNAFFLFCCRACR